MASRPLTSLLIFPCKSSDSPSSLLPPAGTQTLLTDSLACPASALLVHFARAALLESRPEPTPVVWVGCDGQGLPHWASICKKVGLSLQTMIGRDLFTYIDATDVLCREEQHWEEEEDAATEQAGQHEPFGVLYSLIREALKRWEGKQVQDGKPADQVSPRALVLVDDISSLAWSLRSTPPHHEVNSAARSAGRWAAALRRLCAEHSTSLVTLQHSRQDPLSTHLFTRLFRSSSLWIEVRGLSSGMARDCTGQIAVHPLEYAGGEAEVVTPAKGNGKAVLFMTGNDGKTVFWPRGSQGTA